MNLYYRIVFNRSLGVMQAVSELARGRSKCGRSARRSGPRYAPRMTHRLARWHKLSALSSTTILAGSALFFPLSAHSQSNELIDGSIEIVDGQDPDGHGPGTKPSPWNLENITIRDGGLTIRNAGVVINDGYTEIADQAGSAGTLSILGTSADRGVMETHGISKGEGGATLEINGGIVRAGAHNHEFISKFAQGDIQLGDGNAYIDTNNFDIGISSALHGAGTLNKLGQGKLTLSGLNEYAGGTRIEGGILSVASDSNLGASSGTLELDGGTLRITDSDFTLSTRGIHIGVNGGGFDMEFNSDAGQVVTLSGVISGPGDLTKLGRGDLRLTGDNLYGNTYIHEGELIGNSRSISGDVYIDEDGALTFHQQIDGQFAGDILDTVTDGMISTAKTGEATLEHTGFSSANWLIEDGQLITSADRFLGYVVTGPDGTITFHETGDASLTAAVLGMGQLNKTGDGTLHLPGDSSGFTGHTTITEGTLAVGGSDGAGRLGGVLTVAQGGTLAGTGQVGTTTVESGGTLAPGLSIGTLTIDGDLTLNSGARLDMELGSPHASDPALGISDRLDVAGNLSLDGTLNLIQSGDADDGRVDQGYYRLITYTGDLTDNGINIGDTPTMDTPSQFELDMGEGRVDLFVMHTDSGNHTLQYWQGGNGTWNTTDPMWLNHGATDPTTWAGHQAIFKDEGLHLGGTVEVQGTQRFEGLQFVDNGYELTGTGELETVGLASEIRVLADQARIDTQITGTGGLIKTQAGTLVLSGQNAYEGGTRIVDGVVSVAADNNLGAASGGLELNGGTLRITDSDFAHSARDIQIGEDDGGFDMAFNSDEDQAVTLSGVISGPGDLVKLGRGDLHLTGDNSYGNTYIYEGELIGSSHTLSGDVYLDDDGALTFDQQTDGQFAGNIDGTDHDAITVMKMGDGSLQLTGHSSIGWVIGEGELITSAQRYQGETLLLPDGTITFHETDDASLVGAVLGMGQLNKTGDGTLHLPGDSSGFTGHTTITEGTLAVGGSDGAGRLGGVLTVAQGGTLAGTGQVGTTTIESGGTLAPGLSIGTLAVDGDLTFKAGSRYDVEVQPGGTESDLITVSGTATLEGGSVVHIGANGQYAPQADYRILEAGTNLTGTFDEVKSNLAFLTPSLTYDYDNYTIDLNLQRNDSSFESKANTPNQWATAQGLGSLPSDHALYQRILNLADDAPPAVYDSLSGEIHASVVSAMQTSSNTIRTVPLSHLRSNLSAGMRPGAPIAQSGHSALPASSLPQSAARPLWAEVIGSWRTMSDDGNAARLKQSIGGVFLGGDYEVGSGWRVGAALGYTDSTVRVDDRDSKADIDTYSAALYGGKAFELDSGQVNLMLGGSYSRHSIKTRRHAAVADWDHTLKAKYRAHTNQIFGEVGYAMPVGQTTIEPFAGLAWTDTRTRSFSESGGPTALSGSRKSHDITTSTLGLRASTPFEIGEAQGRLQGSVAWRHAFGSDTPERSLAFDSGQPFTIAGVPIARNTALLELAAEVDVSDQASIGISYGAQLGGGNREHVGKLNVRWQF